MRASRTKVVKGLIGRGADAEVYEQAGHHNTCTALSRLAMHRCHIVRMALEPRAHVETEWMHHINRWRVVVVEWIVPDARVAAEKLPIVYSFFAQVPYTVMITWVVCAEKVPYLLDIVAVGALEAASRKSHSDESVRDVSQVEIEAVRLEACFVKGNHLADLSLQHLERI